MKNLSILLFTVIIFCSMSCGGGASDSSSDPANLNLVIEVSDDSSGDVTITATATNTVEYYFYMGDGSAEVRNSTGVYNHSYSDLGTYLVEVRAYGADGRFIKKTQQVPVQSNDPAVIGEGYSTPSFYEGMNLLWNDEFDGLNLNESFWTYEIGNGSSGWGNNELEYYRKENTSVNGGLLTIQAREESYNGFNYTSSRLITKDKFDFQYGRVDIRATIPEGQGIWPALWMLGSNISSVSWPRCGEIDIMELIGHEPSTVHGTVHYPTQSGSHLYKGSSTSLSGGGKFSDEFHVFSVIWEEDKIEFYMDDNIYYTITPSVIGTENPYPFNSSFFFIMNVAVGGNWPGSPDASTVFPQEMLVDYIRVFQKN